MLRGWAIQTPCNDILVHTIRQHRTTAIHDWMEFFEIHGARRTWRQMRRWHWRCVKVRVEALEPAEEWWVTAKQGEEQQ